MGQGDVERVSAEIGYWLGEEFWGRGIVSEALRAVTDYAFATFDLCRIYAGVFEWNPASMRVLEKAGYEFECRMKKSVSLRLLRTNGSISPTRWVLMASQC